MQLKRILKHGKDFSMNKQIQQLVEQLDKNSKFVESQRNSVSFGPADTEQAVLDINCRTNSLETK